jgi:signal peptidase I
MVTRLDHLGSPSGRFPVHELPHEAHQPVLHGLVILRVVSSSMEPALRIGDRVEIAPAGDLRIGDLILFRQDALLICHRLLRIDDRCLHAKGDAVDGPPERILHSDVVGRVAAIVRGGSRLAVPPAPRGSSLPSARWRDSISRVQAKVRHLVSRVVAGLLKLPVLGGGLRRLIIQCAVVDLLDAAPLRSVRSHIKRTRVRLAHFDRLRLPRAPAGSTLDPVGFIVRIGPLRLATGTLAPWTIHTRCMAKPLRLDRYLADAQPPETAGFSS